MISVIHAIKHDHTYVAKPGEKAIRKRVKISLEWFIKYIVFQKLSFNIETKRLQTVNWLVVSHNDNHTESSKTCQLCALESRILHATMQIKCKCI